MHVACRLHGLAGHGQHIEPEGAIDAGDADGGEQGADGGWNQRHQQRDQVGDIDVGLQVDRNWGHRRHHDDEDQRQYGEQDGQRHLVRRFLPLGPFDEMDHAIEEAFAGIGGGADQQKI